MKSVVKISAILLMVLLFSGCGVNDAPDEPSKSASLNVIAYPDTKCQLFSGNSIITEWTGSKLIGGLAAGSYKIIMFGGSKGGRYEEVFELVPHSTKVIEPGTGTLSVTTDDAFDVKLLSGGVEINHSNGSKRFDSLWIGKYTVVIKESEGTEFSDTLSLSKDQLKIIEALPASIQITTNIPTAISKLILKDNIVRQITGNGTFSNLLPGNYQLKVSAVDYQEFVKEIVLTSGENMSLNAAIISNHFTMIPIETGTLTMGCTWAESECYWDELPAHQVTLSGYEIGKYEVTQKMWREVMGTNPSYFTGDNLPVEQVSWFDIVNFCNKASALHGLTPVYTIEGTVISADWSANGYRLPTEAEWEFAARESDRHSYSNYLYSGFNNLDLAGWHGGNSGGTTHEVGTKWANRLGIHDMTGNVWEACWDWYGAYNSVSQANPKGPVSGTQRILRGGSYLFDATMCRVAKRESAHPEDKGRSRGFRLARTK